MQPLDRSNFYCLLFESRQHGDIDDSQASVAETAEKLEIEHIESNSKVDLLEKELSGKPQIKNSYHPNCKPY